MASTTQPRYTAAEVEALLELERALCSGVLFSPMLCEVFTQVRTAFYRAIPYDVYLQTKHWQQTRKIALEAYGDWCRWCEGKFEDHAPIHIHHLRYDRLGREPLTDLIPLCALCHERWHRQEEQWKGDHGCIAR